MGRKRTWTDDDLRAAVAHASTYTEVVELLRSRTGACSYMSVRVRIAELGIEAEHLERARRAERAARERARVRGESYTNGRPRGGHRPRWKGALADEDAVREAVDGARSYAQVLRRLGLKPGGTVYRRLQERITELGLDTSAMKGQAWARGLKAPSPPSYTYQLDEILVKDSRYLNNVTLKKRLLRADLLVEVCYVCGLREWRGQTAPLRLDHINGDRRDNRLENLRMICPNCDAFQDTHCARNIGRYDDPEG